MIRANPARRESATPTHIDSPLISVSAALGGAVILILLVTSVTKRFGFAGVGTISKKILQVRASVSLSLRERVVIIDIEDALLVLGVTASQITHLHTLPPARQIKQPAPKNIHADFQYLMEKLLTSNVKK